jgi:dipeptidyl aminopeptidase/acylaminoacyl peptidase
MSRMSYKFIAMPVFFTLLLTSCDILHESDHEGFCTPNIITEIWILDRGNGVETYLADGGNPKFSPDGNEIFFTDLNQILKIRLDTRTTVPITPRLEYLAGFQVCRKTRTIVYSAGDFSTNSSEIFLRHLDDGRTVNLTHTPFSSEWAPSFSFDGTRVAFEDGRYLASIDLEGNPTLIRKLEYGTFGRVRYNWDATKLLCVRYPSLQLNVFDLADTTRDFFLPTQDETYAVSPVRDEIVIFGGGLNLVNLDTRASIRLADFGNHSVFSDDGQQVAFAAWEKLILTNRDGQEQIVLSTNSKGFESVDISPDGRLFVFSRIRREDICD